ncbi:MAG: ribosome maturation factor RimM [Bacillota bacterium]|nr:ribosome maturation factor RimM [Bacillota bacterium]
MRQPVRFVAIGEIVAPHGLRGEVRVLPLTDFPERFETTGRVLLGPPGGEPAGAPVAVERARRQGRLVLLKLAGVDSVEAAESLRGRLLFVPRQEVVPLPEGRFYVFDLVGLLVVTEDGAPLGKLVAVLDNPANDLFVVRPPGGGRDILLPALKSVVREIDLAGGRMVVSPLPGMLEASEASRE